MTTGTAASQTKGVDAESKRERGRSRHRSRHHGDRRSAPSSSAAVIDAAAAAAVACARPLHVVLPACATDKIVLPPAPVSAKYTAVFEVEFVNASPDTKIDLALAMRVDGHALLRNVQEVEADARRCVRLQVEVEVPKGHTASLSWRPFSRKPERLPAWLTIGRGEARMAVSAPPQQQQFLGHPQQPPAVATSLPAVQPFAPQAPLLSNHAQTNGNGDDSTAATHLVSDVEEDDRRRRRRRDRRRATRETKSRATGRHIVGDAAATPTARKTHARPTMPAPTTTRASASTETRMTARGATETTDATGTTTTTTTTTRGATGIVAIGRATNRARPGTPRRPLWRRRSRPSLPRATHTRTMTMKRTASTMMTARASQCCPAAIDGGGATPGARAGAHHRHGPSSCWAPVLVLSLLAPCTCREQKKGATAF